ncbi:uncharacterized protein [Penaeus vannamei]|uniref:uncharacterized protein n=1 Tax=Penaeus vannamei TaxID=6689 RepID=UPI00387F46B8
MEVLVQEVLKKKKVQEGSSGKDPRISFRCSSEGIFRRVPESSLDKRFPKYQDKFYKAAGKQFSNETHLLLRNEGQTGENPRDLLKAKAKAAYKRAALLAVDTFARPPITMKFLVLLALIAAAAGEHSHGGHGHFPHGGHTHFLPVRHGFRHTTSTFPHRPRPFRPAAPPVAPVHPVVPQPPASGVAVDDRLDDSEYHFSWRHDGSKTYTWDGANQYCRSLGSGWQGISIETREEDSLVSKAISGDLLPWIWTSGHIIHGLDWAWASGAQFVGLNWSHTGGNGQAQPDNRERGGEKCLGVLNNFYNDGVKWHDIACHHDKAIICERKARVHG